MFKNLFSGNTNKPSQQDIFLEFYWDIFLSHTCEFHPLDKDFIRQFEYELDWISISKNKTLDWDIEFLAAYENRFSWSELAWNESIKWTTEKIERFKKRLDWYYLARNRSLPITEEFIVKYAKKLFVAEDHPLLTKELQEKYDIKTVPANDYDSQTIKEYSDKDFDKVFNGETIHNNQLVIYQKVVLPIIENKTLEQIFKDKFNYAQRYYYLEPIKLDIHGLTPELEVSDHNPFGDFQEGRGLLTINESLVLENGSLQEGPDRLYEVPRFSSFSYYPTLLVSENVRSILEQFKLPPHVYHPVTLRLKKLKTSTKYFILQVEYDTLVKDLDFSNQEYDYRFREFTKRGYGVVKQKISSYNQFEAAGTAIEKKYPDLYMGVTIYPKCFCLTTDADMYSYSAQGSIIVNQYVKDALEKYFPGQMKFSSAQLLNIRIKQELYDAKAQQEINSKRTSQLSYTESQEDKYYYAKAERLEREEPVVTEGMLEDDKFRKKEIELNVVFPRIFKNNYLRKALDLEGYELLPISRFYRQDEYAARYPETYKSVAIAENGGGDTINLLLERDDDFRLQNRLFEFLHETGEYVEV
ncbi:MAG: hypothetical protein K0Q66_735 [Chitinophagaceae bacterium]|jgi:hypothetical protein|nr:hypothetical protein [Chitinophagaceae bacterium]